VRRIHLYGEDVLHSLVKMVDNSSSLHINCEIGDLNVMDKWRTCEDCLVDD
jgi:hypothetical protein